MGKGLFLSSVAGAILLSGALAHASPGVSSRKVSWTQEGKRYEGEVVFDKARLKKQKKLPGVMVVHQWMGPTSHERDRAEMLAKEGYVAFVADIYGVEARPTAQPEAAKISSSFKDDRAAFRGRLLDNLTQMAALPEVDSARLGAIGFCFGGTGVLELARAGAPVKGVASFHGGLDSAGLDGAKEVKGSILVLHGEADPLVAKAGIEAMTAEFNHAKIDWQLINYGGAVHSFTQKSAGNDPSKGVAYDAKADRRSWSVLLDFLREQLAP